MIISATGIAALIPVVALYGLGTGRSWLMTPTFPLAWTCTSVKPKYGDGGVQVESSDEPALPAMTWNTPRWPGSGRASR